MINMVGAIHFIDFQAPALIVTHKCAGVVIPAGKRVSSASDDELNYVHVSWVPAQICLEQICINPKGVRQDSLT